MITNSWLYPDPTCMIRPAANNNKTFHHPLLVLEGGISKGADYSRVIEGLEKIQFPLSYSWGVVGHLMGVKNSEELRKAHDEIQPSVVEVQQKLGQSQPVFQALKHLKTDPTIWKTLDEGQQRIVTSALRQMEFSGVGLAPEQREKFNKLQLEAAELSTKFSNNVLDSTKAFKLRVTDFKDVEGLPQSALELAAQRAKADGDADATAEKGPWVITLDMPSYLPAMQHIRSPEVREKLYRAYVTRASTGDQDNAPIIKRILEIKNEISKMLGFKSIAEKSLAAKMAPSVDAVMQVKGDHLVVINYWSS
jgi:oligopeptidase A